MSKATPQWHRALVTLTPAVKAAVIRDAEANDRGMTDAILEKLTATFGVAWTPTGKKPVRATSAEQMDVIVRMPVTLYRKIRQETARTVPSRTISAVVNEELAAAYDLTVKEA